MVQAVFSHNNHLALAIRDKMTESREESINILMYFEALEKYSTGVGTAPINASSLPSGSVSRQQSANVTMEQQYRD